MNFSSSAFMNQDMAERPLLLTLL